MAHQYLGARRTRRGIPVMVHRMSNGGTLYVPIIGSWEIETARQRSVLAAERTMQALADLT